MTQAVANETILTGEAIARRIDDLATLSDDPECLTRLTLRPAHRKAAGRVSQWMREAGLDVRIDGLGTVVGRYASADPGAPTLLIGSHIDTVRDAGRYDGNFGVIAGIAALDEINRTGVKLPFDIEVLAFGDEEGVRFASTLTGSRAAAGVFNPAALDDLDATGQSRREALLSFGVDPDHAEGEARNPARTIGYVELHIEQGPILEANNLPIGIVTAINGGIRAEIEARGESGHAGTQPMNMRRDALTATAELMLAVEAIARAQTHVVATVGRVEALRGATNTIPGHVRMSLDIRSPDDSLRNAAMLDVRSAMARIGAARGVSFKLETNYEMPATPCDLTLMSQLEESIRRLGQTPFYLPSGAGHDAMSFRGILPVAMIFTRCRAGISHNPLEFASPADMEVSTRVLYDFILSLGKQP